MCSLDPALALEPGNGLEHLHGPASRGQGLFSKVLHAPSCLLRHARSTSSLACLPGSRPTCPMQLVRLAWHALFRNVSAPSFQPPLASALSPSAMWSALPISLLLTPSVLSFCIPPTQLLLDILPFHALPLHHLLSLQQRRMKSWPSRTSTPSCDDAWQVSPSEWLLVSAYNAPRRRPPPLTVPIASHARTRNVIWIT